MSSSFATAMTASSAARSPFFHAHLQESTRTDEFGQYRDTSAYSDTRSTRGYEREHDAQTRIARGTPPSKSADVKAPHSFSGPSTSSAQHSMLATKPLAVGAMSLPSSSKLAGNLEQSRGELWDILNEVQDPPPEERHHHYLTHSQSSSGYYGEPPQDKKQQHSRFPKLPLISSKSRGENDSRDTPPKEVMSTLSTPALTSISHRKLSPIEEASNRDSSTSPTVIRQFQADNASIHSTASNQSGLFIHRPVRRTGSSSTFNSITSPNGIASPEREEGDGPAFAYIPNGPRAAYPRAVAALPVIPASPRESQTVAHDGAEGNLPAIITFPQPAAYPATRVKDYADIIVPTGRNGDTDDVEDEEDLGAQILPTLGPGIGPAPQISVTDSGDSQGTQITFATDSNNDTPDQSRRNTIADETGLAPGQVGGDGGSSRDVESAFDDDEHATANDKFQRRLRVLKLALLTPLAKAKWRQRHGGVSSAAHTLDDGLGLPSVRPKELQAGGETKQQRRMGPVALVAHIAWSGATRNKPAELLFWAGFLAPWCWLIGGWMLRRDGKAVDGGRFDGRDPSAVYAENARIHRQPVTGVEHPNRLTQATDNAVVPSTRTSISSGRPDSHGARAALDLEKGLDSEKPEESPDTLDSRWANVWRSAKSSSAELLVSLRGRTLDDSQHSPKLKPLYLQGDHDLPQTEQRMDPWVVRCRVAAIVSGLILLGLVIYAIVVLARAL